MPVPGSRMIERVRYAQEPMFVLLAAIAYRCVFKNKKADSSIAAVLLYALRLPPTALARSFESFRSSFRRAAEKEEANFM